MRIIETWRGQAPAWQCDTDGGWNARFITGALEEANRIFVAAAGAETGSLEIRIDPDLRPRAGSMVAVRSELGVDGQNVLHRLVENRTERALATASASLSVKQRVGGLAGFPAPDGFVAGPLGMVSPWQCDVMHHMNVQFYAARLTEAEAALAAHVGLDPADPEAAKLRPAEHRFRFAGELAAGDALAADISLLSEPGGVVARTELKNAVTGKAAASMESDLQAFDPKTGLSVALPPGLRGKLAAMAPQADLRPVWTAGDWSPDAGSLARMEVLGRQEAQPWEIDHTGVMPPTFFFARMAVAVPYLLDRMGLDRPFMQANGFGRAAVGYRLRYLGWPRAGDCLELRSGVGAVADKTWRFRHGFVDLADGQLVCAVEAVIVLFSLVDRRSVALPANIRATAQAMSV